MHISGRNEEVDELEEFLLGLLGVHSSISNSTVLSTLMVLIFTVFAQNRKNLNPRNI